MCVVRSRELPPRPARRAGRVLLVLLAIALAGCARSGPYAQVGGPQPAVADAGRSRVEIEADGLPTQTPPLRRESSETDDPSEPFSRNYGPRPAPAPAMKAAAAPSLSNDLPPALRRRLASAVGE
jgi:hypothetical protein